MPVVERELARVSDLAARSRLPLIRWHDLRLRASVLSLVGRFPGALALNAQARALGITELAEDLSAAGMSGAFEQQHVLVTGERLAPDPQVLEVLHGSGATPVVLVSRALVTLLQGDVDAAVSLYEGLRAQLADSDFVSAPGVAFNVLPLVEAFGDTAAAEALLGPVQALRGAAGGVGVYGSGSSTALAGRLAVVLGRREEAVAGFDEALRVDMRTGARPAVVHDRIGLAAVLLDGGSAADVTRAAELARTALADARRPGMPGPERQAAALVERSAAAARAADPLTAREREIAGLVAEARTNLQIADQLFLSDRTVETHVRNILAELGLADRTEIATAVVGAHAHERKATPQRR